MDASRLYGSWDLQRWRRIAPDGTEVHPLTEQGRGRILYERAGRMAVFLMNPAWLTADVERGFIAYSGRFKVEDGHVHHLVDFAVRKVLIGHDLVRKVTLRNGLLVLASPSDDPVEGRHELEWRPAAA